MSGGPGSASLAAIVTIVTQLEHPDHILIAPRHSKCQKYQSASLPSRTSSLKFWFQSCLLEAQCDIWARLLNT